MHETYEVIIRPDLSAQWQVTAFQITYDSQSERLIAIHPIQHSRQFLTQNKDVPELVLRTEQALNAFTRQEWLLVDRWLEMIRPQLNGTAFQVAVWQAISQIPVGRVATYQEIAVRVGRPQAVRAVGTACGANPFPFLIPCHRVVATNGMGGYGYGLELKRQLLQFEAIAPL